MSKHIFKILFLVLLFHSSYSSAQNKYKVSASSNEYQSWEEKPVGSGWLANTFAFHDFDGDGITDVFTCYRGVFSYSSGGNTNWQGLTSLFSGKINRVNQLRFGDFDGDGKTDVFLRWKGNFVYCSGGKGKPIILRKADVKMSKIRIGDFDGDGKADIFEMSY